MRRVILNYLNWKSIFIANDEGYFKLFKFKMISTANEEGGKEWDKGNAVKLKLKASPRKSIKISSRNFYQFVGEDKA